MRTARRAGLMADTTVTPTPTTRQTMTVRASKTSGPEGSVTPNPLSSASSPIAASTPKPSPMRDDTSPTIAASRSTERKTWRRLAPTMRSNASSRVRCPTMMENVLRMVKPPTNSAMNANTSSAVLREAQCLADGAGRLVDDGLTGHHLFASGQDARDGALHRRLVGARLRHDVDGVELAHLTQQRLGRRCVEGGERRSGQVVGGAEARQPRDGEGPRRALAAGSARVHPL